jgi:hypothetical protein
MALTNSLRKTLLGLFAAMTCVVMFIYWNQNTMKPSTIVMSNTERTSKEKLVDVHEEIVVMYA